MKYLSLILITFLLLPGKGGDLDERLIGRWREPVPSGENHDGIQNELVFTDKGEFKANKIIYDYDEESGTWAPYTAEQLANGYNDTWETENGFLTMDISENSPSGRDRFFRYTIVEDTFRIWRGEVFEGKNESIVGNWSYEIKSHSEKGKSFRREVEVTADGKFMDIREDEKDMNEYIDKGDYFLFIRKQRGGRDFPNPDTLKYFYFVKDKKLYTWQEPELRMMIRY